MLTRLIIHFFTIMFLFTSKHTINAFTQNGPWRRTGSSLSHITLRSLTSDTHITSSDDTQYIPPWNRPAEDMPTAKRNKTRFRQHVNPLSRNYQLPTILPQEWPQNVFQDISKPLFLDIGCGKGGFLLEISKQRPQQNYLGLEIRPSVVRFAKERVAKRGLTGLLDFVGCNANVDLERILALYQQRGGGPIDFVSIQFPDPHFKAQHAKRRVVTESLILTLAKFIPPGGTVFLQSDIQNVLDDMRDRFRQFDQYFQDQVADVEEYMPLNIVGIATEREISVLQKDLPVFRTVFKRTSTPVSSP